MPQNAKKKRARQGRTGSGSTERAHLGGCTYYGRNVRVHRAATAHFPYCEPGDCYCTVSWSEVDECAHVYFMLAKRLYVCDRCKHRPAQLPRGQAKAARDRTRAARKYVARHWYPTPARRR